MRRGDDGWNNCLTLRNLILIKEDNRREVKKARGGTAGVLMGYLFVLCQLLWRSHYPWREGGKRRVRFFAVREKKGWEEPQIEEKLDDVEGTILTLPFKKKVEKKC